MASPKSSRMTDKPSIKHCTRVNPENKIQTTEPKTLESRSKDNKKTNIVYQTGTQYYETTFVPDTNLTLACLVCLCFNIPLGLVAMYLSISAAKFYRDGDPKQGERKAKCSVIISLFSIVTTVLLVMSYVLWITIETQNKRKLRET
ncbi:hypothetical protein DPMN_191772 [Dreissena polymorpha]|uniref:Uncharacterized protein n=1 Tax=Dreissena polymorpha TaxID=45954 RepID=A0A9D3XV53_DREPO|nr:hypothetical protein DPMN_191772 [Dreissena polymorpha]